jgi:hypothetical protein
MRGKRHVQQRPRRDCRYDASVWLKAGDSVGDWEDRKRRITAGLEATEIAGLAVEV